MLTAVVLAFALFLQGAPAAPRTGVITGAIVKDGAPAAAVRVSAIPAPPPNVRPSDGQNYFPTALPVATVLSDSQGRYRLTNLPAGRYLIFAGMLGQGTFYPSTADANRATVVTIEADTPAAGLDFALLHSLGGRIAGRVTPASSPGVQERAVLSGLTLGEILETPLGSDGSFEFGHVPAGTYILSLFPTPPGVPSLVFQVGVADMPPLEIVRQPLRTIRGRLVVPAGPIPRGLLAFVTAQSHVAATVNPDGTFTASVHAAQHQVDLGGMPIGYRVASVRVGAADASKGITVGNSDIDDVVITLTTPARLPRVHGRVAAAGGGAPATRVELTGRILGTLEAPVQADGSFEFAAVTPGFYRLRLLPERPGSTPQNVVVGWDDAEIQVGPAAR